MARKKIKNLSDDELISYFEVVGEKKYRMKQLQNAIYVGKVQSFDAISNFSTSLQEKLESDFLLKSLTILDTITAGDGSIKFLYSTLDGEQIETIFLPNVDNNNPHSRNTLCVSTMVGCPVNCKFCATAKLGFKRNLETSEIIDQLLITQTCLGAEKHIKNVVFMGMGEPFLNYENLMRTINIIRTQKLLIDKAITISTIGIPEKIVDFTNLGYKIKLALSLHSPDDATRQTLIPIAKKYKIEEILKALDYYYRSIRLPITFEYTLFKGVNDSDEDVKKIARISRRFPSKVNLIPYNDISFIEPDIGLVACSSAEIKDFAARLYKQDVMTITRKSQGKDIYAACGQLANRK